MLEARDLHKSYRMGAVSLPVLQGVNLQVPPGRFLAITGPSGAGKSTLLHLLAGLDVPTHGEVTWEGQVLSGMGDARRARFRNGMMGVVFQFYHLLPELSALENVMLPGLVGGSGNRRAVRMRAAKWLERVQLGARMHHRPQELSGGEQQRVAIARALINEPKVLLCDEPTGNLDSATGSAIADLLREIHRQTKASVVLATHDAALAGLAEQTVMLRDGRTIDDGQEGVAAHERRRT